MRQWMLTSQSRAPRHPVRSARARISRLARFKSRQPMVGREWFPHQHQTTMPHDIRQLVVSPRRVRPLGELRLSQPTTHQRLLTLRSRILMPFEEMAVRGQRVAMDWTVQFHLVEEPQDGQPRNPPHPTVQGGLVFQPVVLEVVRPVTIALEEVFRGLDLVRQLLSMRGRSRLPSPAVPNPTVEIKSIDGLHLSGAI